MSRNSMLLLYSQFITYIECCDVLLVETRCGLVQTPSENFQQSRSYVRTDMTSGNLHKTFSAFFRLFSAFCAGFLMMVFG
jgi:hypothetical protein